MSTFQYVGLLKESEVRLLRLHPGEWLEDLEATLYVTDRSREYVALSYAWGSTRTSNQIIVNGKVHSITFNLDRALRAVRRRTEPVTLWVDSICINQHDAAEKSKQVGLMHDIFGWATEVIAYIGDGLDRSRKDYPRRFEKLGQYPPVNFTGTRRDEALAYQYLVDLWKKLPAGPASENDEIVSLFSFLVAFTFESMNDSFVNEHFASLTTHHSTEEQKIQLMAERIRLFAASDWWNRMWIIQEACVARNLTIAYGRVTMPFTFIVDATENFLQLSSLRSKELSQVMTYLADKVNAIDAMRFRGAFGNVTFISTTSPLLWLLRRFRSRKSSEPRDKIFALLRLAKDLKKERIFQHSDVYIQANYDLDVSVLFASVAYEIILQTGLVWMTTFDLVAKSRKDVPSWVPDWSSDIIAPGFDQRRFRLHGEISLHFNASRAMFRTRRVESPSFKLVPRQHIERLIHADEDSTWEPVHLLPKLIKYTHYPHNSGDQQRQALILNSVNCGHVETVSDIIRSDLSNLPLAILQTHSGYITRKVWRMYRESFLDIVAACLCYSLRVSSENGGCLYLLEPEQRRRATLWIRQKCESCFSSERLRNAMKPNDSNEYQCAEPSDGDPQNPLEDDEIHWIEDTVRTMAAGCRLFVTVRGQLGIGPEKTGVGDDVCIVEGGLMPYILRAYAGSIQIPLQQAMTLKQLENVRKTTMVGTCYVEGIMHWGRESGETEDDPRDIEHLDSKLRRRLYCGNIEEEGIMIL
ncbi:Heterokaryon incompatibility protein 6, OR allele [Colletotrichum tanaceti]|uniref:Heterokaryon incompatibility protein 6, OR allele n=1 Tax=Colletotrichum tanaceti TaxID=1306861 RepID=A0A4U6XSN2_9PEZI|nr:Heterokaryon incompatibility protein 6, OR allele [Colletotrichum tanaceti]